MFYFTLFSKKNWVRYFQKISEVTIQRKFEENPRDSINRCLDISQKIHSKDIYESK
jgi:hypothetical protein